MPVNIFPQECIFYNSHDISSLRLFAITHSFCFARSVHKKGVHNFHIFWRHALVEKDKQEMEE